MPSARTITNSTEFLDDDPRIAQALSAKAAEQQEARGAVAAARQVLLIYGAVYYFVPAILTALFGAPLDQILISSPNYLIGAVFCAIVIGCVYYIMPFVSMPKFLFLRPIGIFLFDRRTMLAFSAVFLLLSYYFWRQFGLSYRQTGTRIENSGSAVILLYIFQNYILTSLLVLIGLDGRMLRRNFIVMGGIIGCIIVGSVLSIQASSNVVSLVAALIVAVRLFLKEDFLRVETQSNASRIWTYAFLGAAAAGALLVGIANKRGVDQTMFLFFNNFEEIISIFQTRISYNFYSASFHATYNFLNIQLGWQAVQEVATNIQHRVDVLLGIPTTFNEITSVKRLNYEEITFYFRERTGTSPGLVGSVFFYPLGVFLLPLIVAFYAAVYKMIGAVSGRRAHSLVELVYMMLFVGGILDASIDLFNPFDTPFTKMFFTLCAFSMIGRTASQRIADDRLIQLARTRGVEFLRH